MEFFESTGMADLRQGDVLQNRYRIDHLLGEGSMSWVYRGHHLLLEQPVAIKVVKPLYTDPTETRQHIEQLRVEAKIMARLDHPNLVRVFDMFPFKNESVLILELVEGRNLEEIAELAPKVISERRVLAWTFQILDALEYLHSQQPPVIVRDLKPANILLGPDGRIRLIDFGLAKQMNAQGSGTRNIVRGMGSEGYAPLEQYAHTSTDGRSDLYALGATMYFLLTKSPPPPATSRIAEGEALPDPCAVNPSISENTWSVMQALLAMRADNRPPNAAAVRKALKNEPESEVLPPDEKRPPTAGQGKRCVSCDLLLAPVMKQGVEIDFCTECGGVWLDRGELGRLVRLGSDEADSAPEVPATTQSTDRDGQDTSHTVDKPDAAQSEDPQKPQSALYKVWKLLEDLFD